MKQKLILIAAVFILVFSTTPNARSQWIQTVGPNNDWGTSFAVIGIDFFAGSAKGVLISTDSGLNWSVVNTGLTDTVVFDLVAFGSELFAGTGSGVFRSTDSGESWMTADNGLPTGAPEFAITTPNALALCGSNIFAACAGGSFFSTDTGTTWAALDTTLHGGATSFQVSGANIFAMNAEGIFLSTNGGTIWNSVNTNLTDQNVQSFTLNGSMIFAVTSDSAFLSTNNGTTWTSDTCYLGTYDVFALAASGKNLFAGTFNKGVFYSPDSGRSWIAVSSGFQARYVISLFVSEPYLFAGASESSDGIWRRPLSEMIGSSAVNPTPSLSNSLISYPNPFTQSTTITLTTPASGVVELSMVNLLGEEVAHIYDGELGAGEHSFSWNASGLPIGTYFGVVRMNGLTQELPMILSR
jgi:hypothetical protein